MANFVKQATEQLHAVLVSAVKTAMDQAVFPQAELPVFSIEIPSDNSHGDFATNLAMISAKAFHQAPRKIAETICRYIELNDTFFVKYEIAGPGFINFFLAPVWFAKVIENVQAEQRGFGRSDYGKGEKVMVEFVSANPTGPMHMGNARGGALGDCIAEFLSICGHNVTKEFYVNDAGNQIEKFGKSLSVRYLQLFEGEGNHPFPEDGYQGVDIIERAKEFAQIHGDSFVSQDEETRKRALTDYALPRNVDKLKCDLELYRIHYDVWFSEKSLHDGGAIREAIDVLTQRGLTYQKDEALWYKATDFGGEKDEVLIRTNGTPTYFAADIAYHYNKFKIRGFDRVINVLGADHHGHVARLKGAMDAIGLDGNKLEIVLIQFVRLMKDGQPFKMSKRTGKAISLTDLIEEVPVDAARFYFNNREANSTLDFDLDLAVEQSSQNPVYYVQYAHARICSILKNLAAEGIQPIPSTLEQLMLLQAPEEIEVIRHLAKLPNEIIETAKNYDPARMTRYVTDLATLFHKFYNSCRVKGEEANLMQARIALCTSVKVVLENVLAALKITAPDAM